MHTNFLVSKTIQKTKVLNIRDRFFALNISQNYYGLYFNAHREMQRKILQIQSALIIEEDHFVASKGQGSGHSLGNSH